MRTYYNLGANVIRKVGMEDNKKRGPRYKNGIPKEKRFTIRLDEKEHQEFIEKAKKRNMTIAEYLRYLVKNDK